MSLYQYLSKKARTVILTAFFCPSMMASQQLDSTLQLPLGYDPIAAMLDSLVTQSYIQKLDFATPKNESGYLPYEIPTFTSEVYKARMEKIQTPIPLAYNREVAEYVELYAIKRRSTCERVMGLSQLYFPIFEQALDQNDLPHELKYLAIVESALNPCAVSPVGATGIWQFMLQTGKMYDLKINSYIDERRDPLKATNAACKYFKDMYAIYKDWLLVIASYNCGPGNVNKAIARSGGKRTFWEISPYLPRETRGYVPAFVAVTYLMNYPNEHNLRAIAPLYNYFEVDTVLIDQKTTLREIADGIAMSEDQLAFLNPIFKKRIIPEGDEPYALRLPVSKVNPFLANLENIIRPQQSLASNADGGEMFSDASTYITKTIKKQHKVRRGENIGSIANKYNCSTSQIKKWNRLRSSKLYAGQRLTVYVEVKKKQATPTVIASNSVTVQAPSDTMAIVAHMGQTNSEVAEFKYHIVQRGDTLWNIAQRYEGVTVQQIKRLNKLNGNAIKVGTKLKLGVKG